MDSWYNFQGIPTLDTTDRNDGAAGTVTLSTGAGVSNSKAPGLSWAMVGGNGGLGATTSDPTNGYGNYWDSQYEGSGTVTKIAAKPVIDINNRTTTFAWNTGRAVATNLINFIDVTGGKIKYKSGGVFTEKTIKTKVGGTFDDKDLKVKVSGVFN